MIYYRPFTCNIFLLVAKHCNNESQMRKGRAEFPLSYFFVLVMGWDSSTGNIQRFLSETAQHISWQVHVFQFCMDALSKLLLRNHVFIL